MESMSPKKLEKLCYYAYAWYITLNKKRLFNQHFEAWIPGPVNPDLFHKYREYGWNVIPQVPKLPIEIAENEYLCGFLEKIFESYGGFDAGELVYLTCQEDPWKNARKGLMPSTGQRSNWKTAIL